MKYEIAHMRDHGGGVIVNTASIPTTMVPGHGAYGASKAGVLALSRAAAREHLGDGIRINTICPGPVDTMMSRAPGETDADRDARIQTQHPLGRVATTGEIAAGVLWLASPESSYTIGHDLVIDGGATA
jgi:NAD(P)-dependent dehydrogenase (short-subunit alcohol dehydrogenase family)